MVVRLNIINPDSALPIRFIVANPITASPSEENLSASITISLNYGVRDVSSILTDQRKEPATGSGSKYSRKLVRVTGHSDDPA
jgi:hypothetical protein